MTSCPIFYFSSKKEIPKTHLLINVRNNQNNEPIIEFKSNINLDLQIDGYDYLLDLHILLNSENNREPTTEIRYNLTKVVHTDKIIFDNTLTNLLSFMDDFKYKIEEDVKGESIKLEYLERQKTKESLKSIEDFKIQEHKKMLDELNLKLSLKLTENAKIEQQSRIESTRNLKEHYDIMEDIKIYNSNLLIINKKLQEEEDLSKSHFDDSKIIDYLKNELQKLKQDDEELGTNTKVLEKDKLQYFKEKYNINSENNIIKNHIQDKINVNSEIQIEDEIYKELKSILSGDKNMLYTNLIYIITQLMKFVENFNLEGTDKKTIIIESIEKFLTMENMNSPELTVILNKVCPELIDILLLVDKRKSSTGGRSVEDLVDKRKIIIRKKISCFIPWCS